MFDVFDADSGSGPPSPSEVEERRAIFRPAYVITGIFLGMIQGSLFGVVVVLAMSTLHRPLGDIVTPASVRFHLVRWGMIGGLLGGAAGAIVWPGVILVVKRTRELFGPDLSLAAILTKPSYGAWLFPIFFHSLVGSGTGGFGVGLSVEEEADRQTFQGGLLGFAVGSLLGLAIWLSVWSIARLCIAFRIQDRYPGDLRDRHEKGAGSDSE